MKKEIALSTKSFPQNWKIFESTENTHTSTPLPPLQKKAFNFFQAPMLFLTFFLKTLQVMNLTPDVI